MTVYRVTRGRPYRSHQPGSTFEASLESAAARRALARGDIEEVQPSTPSLQPGSYTIPPGWPVTPTEQERKDSG